MTTETRPLGQIATIVMGQSPPGSTYNRDRNGVPLLNGPAEFGERHPTAVQWTTEPCRFAREGDILFCVRGATTGRKCWSDQQYAIGRGLAAIRGREGICNTQFLWFLLDDMTNSLLKRAAGSTFVNLPGEELLNFLVTLPPLKEQEQIAAELTVAIAAVDKARRASWERLAAAEALPAAYLREVFEGSESRRWKRLPISSLGDPERGDTVQTGPFGAQLPSSEFRSEGVPVLNIGNVKNGGLDLKRLDHVSPQKAADLERYRLRQGDMLFTRSGSVGRSAVVSPECQGWLMSYHLLRVAFDRSRVEPGFASAAIRGDIAVLRQVRLAAGRGATRDGVNSNILSALTIPVPPIEVQQRVLADLSRLLSAVDALIARCREELAAIDALPAALLRQAFSGPQR